VGAPNQPRDSHGRWAAGNSGSSASGDHQSVSPSLTHRNVSGIAVPRSIPVVRLDNKGSPDVKSFKGSARSDKIAALRAVDQRHFGIPGDVGNRVGKMLPKDLRGPSKAGWPFNN
jgi:hypothetical protein